MTKGPLETLTACANLSNNKNKRESTIVRIGKFTGAGLSRCSLAINDSLRIPSLEKTPSALFREIGREPRNGAAGLALSLAFRQPEVEQAHFISESTRGSSIPHISSM